MQNPNYSVWKLFWVFTRLIFPNMHTRCLETYLNMRHLEILGKIKETSTNPKMKAGNYSVSCPLLWTVLRTSVYWINLKRREGLGSTQDEQLDPTPSNKIRIFKGLQFQWEFNRKSPPISEKMTHNFVSYTGSGMEGKKGKSLLRAHDDNLTLLQIIHTNLYYLHVLSNWWVKRPACAHEPNSLSSMYCSERFSLLVAKVSAMWILLKYK
jgi:hypothetical protein